MSLIKYIKNVFINEEKKTLKEKQKKCDHDFEQVSSEIGGDFLHKGDISRTYFCEKCDKIKKINF